MAMPMPAPDRNRTAVLAAAAVVALLAVVGLAVLLLTGDGDEDRLASTTPTSAPTSTPTSTGSASPSPVPPPAEPTAAPSPAEAAPWEVDAAFVTPGAASAAEQPGWVRSDGDPDPGPLLDPCRDRDFPQADAIATSDERGMGSEREAGGSTLSQEVFRYASEQEAAAAFAVYRERVERCPRTPIETMPADSEELTVVEGISGDDRLLVRSRYCNPACTDLYTTYSMVVRAADGLSVLAYSVGEDGDPAEDARALLDVAAQTLQDAVQG